MAAAIVGRFVLLRTPAAGRPVGAGDVRPVGSRANGPRAGAAGLVRGADRMTRLACFLAAASLAAPATARGQTTVALPPEPRSLLPYDPPKFPAGDPLKPDPRAPDFQKGVAESQRRAERERKEYGDLIRRRQAAVDYYAPRVGAAVAGLAFVAAVGYALLTRNWGRADRGSLAASDPWVREQLARGREQPPESSVPTDSGGRP